jgi:hypothetical protein
VSDNVRQQPPFDRDTFVGIQRYRNPKTLEFSAFCCRFRFRPGEPAKTISYDTFLLIYYARFAYAIEPSLAISNPNTGPRFDLASRYGKVASVCD